MATMLNALTLSGLGLILIGALTVTGIFQPLSGSTSSTCIGFLLGPLCVGSWQNNTIVNGNNLIIGIGALFAGAILYLLGIGRVKWT